MSPWRKRDNLLIDENATTPVGLHENLLNIQGAIRDAAIDRANPVNSDDIHDIFGFARLQQKNKNRDLQMLRMQQMQDNLQQYRPRVIEENGRLIFRDGPYNKSPWLTGK